MKIAWIGTGVMGSRMLIHLVKAGHEVSVYNRTYEKAISLEPQVKAYQTIEETIRGAELVFTIVGYPSDVEEVYSEIFKYAKEGAILIDMTTSSAELAVKLSNQAKKQKTKLLDAPVTGGDIGALNGTLTIMVGGEEEVYNQIKPILELMGKTIIYTGKAGSGQRTKSANQIVIAGNLLGTIESLVYAIDNQLNLETTYDIITGGSASSWQLINNGKKIINQDYQPGFYIKHFLKDLILAKIEAKRELEGVNLVIKMLEKLIGHQYENKGTQALIMYYLDQKIKN